jgi:putative Mg2+ transporter-C (MgtC) family protein
MIFDAAELLPTALRLAVALFLGSAIGFERQWHQNMAGLRTNALVALGAGVILRKGVNVHGLNTPAARSGWDRIRSRPPTTLSQVLPSCLC